MNSINPSVFFGTFVLGQRALGSMLGTCPGLLFQGQWLTKDSEKPHRKADSSLLLNLHLTSQFHPHFLSRFC